VVIFAQDTGTDCVAYQRRKHPSDTKSRRRPIPRCLEASYPAPNMILGGAGFLWDGRASTAMHSLKAPVAFLLLFSACVAQARIVIWTLEDMRFSDGSTATGFFTLDNEQASFLANFSLTTTRGILPGAQYTPTTIASVLVSRNEVMLATRATVLDLWVSESLFDLNSQPTIPTAKLALNTIRVPPVSSEHDVNFAHSRLLTMGRIAAIPETSTHAFFGLGIYALWLTCKRCRAPYGRPRVAQPGRCR
jgi:hypothetical protein